MKVDILSAESINQLKKELINYQKTLTQKCEQIVTELSVKGEKVALEKINKSKIGTTITLKSQRTVQQMGCKAVLLFSGEIKEAKDLEPFNTLWAVEFGAGIYYNRGKENPNASEYGLGVGTYPGQIHAFEDGWYFLDEDGEWKYTHGVEATMPVYSAATEIIKNMQKTIRSVLKS